MSLGILRLTRSMCFLCAIAGIASQAETSPDAPTPKPGRQFNVKNYGAKGNGRANDTAAIQAALDAARDAGGGRVYLPGGTYLVSPATDVVFGVASNIEFAGDGPSSIIKIKGGKYNAVFWNDGGGENLAFHDFRVDQNPTGNAANPVGDGNMQSVIGVNNYKNLRVQSVRFEPACGVWAIVGLGPKGNQLLVEDCVFEFVNGRVAKKEDEKWYDVSVIYSQGAHQRILHNVFKSKASEYAQTAIELQGSDVVVRKNTVDYFAAGIILTNSLPEDAEPSGPVTIENNQFLHMQDGIELWASTNKILRNVSITKNVITIAPRVKTSWAQGISHIIYSGPTTESDPDTYRGDVSDIVISGNSITFLDAPPVYTTDSGGQVSSGINFDSVGNVSNLQILNNKIIDPPRVGIHLGNPITNGKLENITVENNLIVNPGWNRAAESKNRAAVKLDGRLSSVQLINNSIKRAGSRGTASGVFAFWAHPSTAENVVLRSNSVEPKDGMASDVDPAISAKK